MNRRTRWVLALSISGAILVGYIVTISVVAERRTGEELARKAAAAEDAINRARTEEGRRLIAKSMAQLAQEARDRDEAAARVEAAAKTRRSETEALVQAEKRCRYLFKEQMPYLEPTYDSTVGALDKDGRGFTFRFIVRISDSFRAAPVGVVECWMERSGNYGRLTKIPM